MLSRLVCQPSRCWAIRQPGSTYAAAVGLRPRAEPALLRDAGGARVPESPPGATAGRQAEPVLPVQPRGPAVRWVAVVDRGPRACIRSAGPLRTADAPDPRAAGERAASGTPGGAGQRSERPAPPAATSAELPPRARRLLAARRLAGFTNPKPQRRNAPVTPPG